ncbi:MAG: PH domain-containing protein [Acidobacteria bacterium]|jgi:uncharacterized membrane protein YdbT with pleckstrin-like domain|nr:PH domain-containing protein [Acidobacteriota bacterium]
MFCTKCGAQNSDEAVYCQKCGTVLEAEEETRLARPARNNLNDDDETQIFSIRPTLMFVKVGYGLAVLGAFLLVFLLYYAGNLFGLDIPWWFSILAGLSLLLIPAFYHFKQKTVRYILTDAKIEIDQGLISHTTKNVPLRTIQDVTVSATVPQRLLGFGNLVIENAGENNSQIVLKNINSPKKYAEVLLKQMRQLNR